MGRFDFRSPGAAAGDAITQYFTRLEQQRRQQMADQLALDREARLKEHDKAALANMQANTQALNEQRAANVAAAQLKTDTAGLRMGDKVNDEFAKKYPFMVATSPLAQGAQIAVSEDDIPTYDVTGGESTYRGTPEERTAADERARREAFIKTLDPNSAQAKFLTAQMQLGDDSLPYQMFDAPATETRNAGGALFEKQADGTWKQVATGPTASGANGRKPYYHRVDQADGVWLVNSTDPNDRTRIGDLKPGETAQKEIANGQTIMWMMDQMTANMTPEKIGPAMGRFKTVEQAITGGDEAFAALASQTAQLQNVVINLRTGAAMSEPEAARIMAELPAVTLPPATFLARLKNAQAYYKQWQQNRARGAYGRTTSSDVDSMVGAPGATPPAGNRPRITKITPVQ